MTGNIILKLIFFGCVYLLGNLSAIAMAAEGSAALFIVDRSAQFADTGGLCIRYTTDAQPADDKELLAIAKGCENSVMLLAAFDAGRDRFHQDLPPVLREFMPNAQAAKLPPVGSDVTWKFNSSIRSADLFVLICHNADPTADLLRKQLANIQAAIDSNQPARTLLLSAGLRSGLTKLMRNQAKTTEARIAPNSIAAVRRGLNTLHDDWKDDSQSIPFSESQPGLMLFKIAP